MGEIADAALDDVITQIDQYYDGQYYDGQDYSPPRDVRPAPKTCRCCGTGGLVWGQHNSKWRLFAGTALHQCPVNPLR